MTYPTPINLYPPIVQLDRATVCLRIRLGLQGRSRMRWTVKGGQAGDLDYGRLVISSPPERRTADGLMAEADRAELTQLLGLDELAGGGGVVVEDSHDHYIAMIDRAEGRAPRLVPEPLLW